MEILEVVLRSLQVSGFATLISLAMGIPFGIGLALSRFPGRKIVLGLINTGMGLPPVVVGLLVSMLLWRRGPLGMLHLLYTPTAMTVAQVLIAFPIIAGLTVAAINQLPPMLLIQIRALGASRLQVLWLLVRETKISLLAAAMAGFGGAISEVGASMMVGGNIRGETRVLTTATVLETSKGNFEAALLLGAVLLVLSFGVNFALTSMQQR